MKEEIILKDVYAIDDGSGKQQSSWTKIGIGFVNKDDSINVVLNAIPLGGRMQIRNRKPKKKKGDPHEVQN